MKYLLPALAAIALAGPVAAADNADKDQPTASDATDKTQNRVICKREKESGSRLKSKKVCMTEAQWAQIKRDNRQYTERNQSNRTTDY